MLETHITRNGMMINHHHSNHAGGDQLQLTRSHGLGVGSWQLPSDVVAALREFFANEREDRAVWIVQAENGDVVDATDNLEYAEWLTRDDEDVPNRSKVDVTVWSGPENREEW